MLLIVILCIIVRGGQTSEYTADTSRQLPLPDNMEQWTDAVPLGDVNSTTVLVVRWSLDNVSLFVASKSTTAPTQTFRLMCPEYEIIYKPASR